MRNGLKKLGFTYCGIIYLENGDPRLAFQKLLTINKYMTEKEKMGKGMPYYALDPELLKELGICQEECYNLNLLPPSKHKERTLRLRKLLGKTGNEFKIIAPFFCDYGHNTQIGEKFLCQY